MMALLRRSVDKAMEAYVEWRQECLRVDAAYECWSAATRDGATPAFSAYTVALDREERAAETYAARIQRGPRLV
jgi:hypothetical protein